MPLFFQQIKHLLSTDTTLLFAKNLGIVTMGFILSVGLTIYNHSLSAQAYQSDRQELLKLLSSPLKDLPTNQTQAVNLAGKVKNFTTQNQIPTTYCNNPIITKTLGSHPNSITTDPDGNIFVSNSGQLDQTTQTYLDSNLNKSTLTGDIEIFGSNNFEPGELISDRDGNIFSINFLPVNSITKINPAGFSSIFSSYPPDTQPQSMAIDSLNNLYVTLKITLPQSNLLAVDQIKPDGQKNRVLQNLPFPEVNSRIIIDSRDRMFINVKQNEVDNILVYALNSILNIPGLLGLPLAQTNTRNVYSLTRGPSNQILALTLDGTNEYIEKLTYRPGILGLLDSLETETILNIPSERVLFQIAYNPVSRLLYGLDFLNNELVRTDLETPALNPITKTSPAPTNLTISFDGKVYFSNFSDSTIRKLDCNTTLVSEPLSIDRVANNGTCDNVIAGTNTNCLFSLNDNGTLLNLDGLTLRLSLQDPTSTQHTSNCILQTLITLKCDALITDQITANGIYPLWLTINDESQIKGQVFIGGNFSNWSIAGNGTTQARPEIVSFEDKLIQSVRGDDGRIYTKYKTSGSGWSGWAVDPASYTDFAITMTAFNNKLFQSAVGSNLGIYTRSSLDGINWSDWQEDGGLTQNIIAMTSFQGKLVQAVRGTNSRIYVRFSDDGEVWGNWREDPVAFTTQAPNLEVFENKLYLAAIGSNTNVFIKVANDINNWTRWSNLGGNAAYQVDLQAIDEQIGTGQAKSNLYMTYVDSGGRIYSRFKNQYSWTPSTTQPGSTNNSTTSASWQGKLYQAVRGGDSQIYERIGL